MTRLIRAILISVAVLASGAASAAVVRFDTSPLLMADVFGGTGFYAPSGTFVFDTDTWDVSSVNVHTTYSDYVSGAYDGAAQAFGLFTTAGVAGLVLDISISYAELEASIAAVGVGGSFFMSAFPLEFDNNDSTLYGDGVDAALFGTVVPLPATLPLLLSALGGLALVGRRRKS